MSDYGLIRYNPMLVINSDDKIEYVATNPEIATTELDKLFYDIDLRPNLSYN